jgi:hypothetical protein
VNCSSKSPLFWSWQSFSAFWNWGEFGAKIPVGLIVIIPCPFGSGKSGSPLDLMQSVYLRALAAIRAGVEFAMPGGTSFSQSVSAFWNCGDGDRGLRPGSTPKAKPPPGAGRGSGKFGSPWARMHSAYFSNCASVGPDWPEDPDPAAAFDWAVVVLGLRRLATPLWAGPPPQADTEKLKAANTARKPADRVIAMVTCQVSRNRAAEPIHTRMNSFSGLLRHRRAAIVRPWCLPLSRLGLLVVK